jgi:hypothetical protein
MQKAAANALPRGELDPHQMSPLRLRAVVGNNGRV